jgi:hypothetical protein
MANQLHAPFVFTARGEKIKGIPWAKYDERDAPPLMGRSDEMRLLCVFENGNCLTLGLGGELETHFFVIMIKC